MLNCLADLVSAVKSAIQGELGKVPDQALRALLEAMYFASLQTEEGAAITFHVVYIDPEHPDPHPPRRIVHDRWTVAPFGQRLPFTLGTVRKLAKASDPRSSSLAVFHDGSANIYVWGLIDQGNSYHDFVTHNADSGPERPGVFQASIFGVGHVVVYRDYERIADLHVDELKDQTIDVLDGGPILDALMPGLETALLQVRTVVGKDVYTHRDHWDASLAHSWLSSLRRLLLRIQQYGHGGALLIAGRTGYADLNVKYGLSYDRLQTALCRNAIATIRETSARDEIFEEHLNQDPKSVPANLYLAEAGASADVRDTDSEIDGALWFISLLSRVDGLVLMTPDLAVKGFGVEIQTTDRPLRIAKATDQEGTSRRWQALDYNHFGTRHRSMMRYCAKHAGSVGFVVSQDGDVRAMTQFDDVLVVWENITLRLDDFERR